MRQSRDRCALSLSRCDRHRDRTAANARGAASGLPNVSSLHALRSPPRPRHAAGRIRTRWKHDAVMITVRRRNDRRRFFRQTIELVELIWLDRLQCQVAIGQPLYAAGGIEFRPFSAQYRDGIALAT